MPKTCRLLDGIKPAFSDRIPFWQLILDQAGVTTAVAQYDYSGSGTRDDPYLVHWLPNDPRNPVLWSPVTRWFITITAAVATLVVALVSSAYTGGVAQIIDEFHVSTEVATLGVSLFVLGFAIGPLLWAPLSEMYGRQLLFIVTYGALTAFNAVCVGVHSAADLMILRFFAGAFGSSLLANAGGVIADMFPASERGLAMAIFASAPFLGPVLGPIIGGFVGMGAGWRWVMGLLAILSGTLWILGTLMIPETYPPVLLRKRAARLSELTGRYYTRGWNQGIGGLAFLGIAVGMILALVYIIPDNNRFIRIQETNNGKAPPEARLPPALFGSVALPIGLFWFAWSNQSSIHWMASITAGVPFGFGMVVVFLSVVNYLIDSYTIFAASVLAANTVLRSLFGAAFPLFTSYMFNSWGIHWASSLPAFLALACVPFPFLFYRYGAAIRRRSKFAHQSEELKRNIRADQVVSMQADQSLEEV
ncbi:hypothetical protein AnigIFM62618_005303 [Aspergillus niger]|nr:hypothetical protein AnigIFM62618_005303 [Aspergillus niger]